MGDHIQEIWVQLGCNKSFRGFHRAPKVAIGAVKLRLCTRIRRDPHFRRLSNAIVRLSPHPQFGASKNDGFECRGRERVRGTQAICEGTSIALEETRTLFWNRLLFELCIRVSFPLRPQPPFLLAIRKVHALRLLRFTVPAPALHSLLMGVLDRTS